MNSRFFGNPLGQTFLTENGKLAVYPSGVAGTTRLLIEARDAVFFMPRMLARIENPGRR